MHIVQSLDTKEERLAAAETVMEALSDGKITTIEWTKIGKSLGVFGKK
jgi:cobalamin biosynthesis protein CobD/CbiB